MGLSATADIYPPDWITRFPSIPWPSIGSAAAAASAAGLACLVYSPQLGDGSCPPGGCVSPYQNKAQDSGKNEKHGDGGRAQDKAKNRIEELEEQSRNATGNERKKIEQKIKNIKRDAARKAKGEEHSRAGKR